MDLTHHRFLALIATVLAALALAATPALASEPDEDDEDDGDVPAQVLPPAPAPVAPAPLAPAPAPAPPAPSAPSVESSPSVTSGGGGVEGENRNNSPKKTTKAAVKPATQTVRAQRTFAVQTSPQGGVQAGAGGMAPAAAEVSHDGIDGAALGLAGTLVLLAGGGMVVRARRGSA